RSCPPTAVPDSLIRPDLGTYRVLPWADRTARLLCEPYWMDGRPNERIGEAQLFEIAGVRREIGLNGEAEVAQREGQAALREGAHVADGDRLRAADAMCITLLEADELDLILRHSPLERGQGIALPSDGSAWRHTSSLSVRSTQSLHERS